MITAEANVPTARRAVGTTSWQRWITGEIDRALRPRKSKAQGRRGPMARQRTLWEEVQQARLRGLALRAIARELGIHRNTAQKYAQAESPPVRLINITPQAPSPDAEWAA